MKLHYLQHVPFEGLGSIEAWAERHGHWITVTRFHAGDSLPPINAFDWLVILGGPMNVYEDLKYPWLQDEKRFIKNVIESGKIVLGICLGAQLLADALGAKIYQNAHREIGWYPIKKTREASRSALSSFLPHTIEVFHWHGDTFDLPPGTVHLVRSEVCENQAFIYEDRVVGLQFHLETNRQSAERLIEHGRDEMVNGPFIQTPEKILSEKAPFQEINNTMDTLLDMLLSM